MPGGLGILVHGVSGTLMHGLIWNADAWYIRHVFARCSRHRDGCMRHHSRDTSF